jgi:hypothetical protein
VSTRTGSSGTIPVAVTRLVDGVEERVELLVAGRIGVVSTAGEDLGGGQQLTAFGADARQVPGATLPGVTVPDAMLIYSLRHQDQRAAAVDAEAGLVGGHLRPWPWSSSRARRNTASSISSVRRPVAVFCCHN